MEKPRFTRLMWLILVACVAIVTLIATFFGLKALVVSVFVISLILLLVENNIGNNKDKES